MASRQGQGNARAPVSGGFRPIFQRFYGAFPGSMRRKSEQKGSMLSLPRRREPSAKSPIRRYGGAATNPSCLPGKFLGPRRSLSSGGASHRPVGGGDGNWLSQLLRSGSLMP